MARKHMLISVFFRAPDGGLHQHVRDQVGFALDAGFRVTLCCPPGTFADSLSNAVEVCTVDFLDMDAGLRKVLDYGPWDILHAHPGPAREFALRVKGDSDVPLVVTQHAVRDEVLSSADSRIDLTVVVANAIGRYLVRKTDVHPSQVVTIPNAVDTERFSYSEPSLWSVPRVLVASRFDPDVRFVTDAVLALTQVEARVEMKWVVAGAGEDLQDLQQACSAASDGSVGSSVRFIGWLDQDQLASEMAAATVIIGPGRVALQGMASGRPTVCLGHKGYEGFLRGQSLLRGLDSNFVGGRIGRARFGAQIVLDDVLEAVNYSGDEALMTSYRSAAQLRSHARIAEAHRLAWSALL